MTKKGRGRPTKEPRRCLTHRGKELGDNMPQGMRRAKGGKEGNRPRKRPPRRPERGQVELGPGACAYRPTSVDMKDKKRIVAPKAFLNPVGFTHRPGGTFKTSQDLARETIKHYLHKKGSRRHLTNT